VSDPNFNYDDQEALVFSAAATFLTHIALVKSVGVSPPDDHLMERAFEWAERMVAVRRRMLASRQGR